MQSDGCNLSDIRGRSVNKTMPFSFATVWLGLANGTHWLPNINCVCRTRSFTCNKMLQMVNKETLIWPTHWVCTSNRSCRSTNQHPVLDTHPQKYQHWKKMVINGIYSNYHWRYPSLPPEATLPTCFIILAQIILQHDQLNWVSSKLQVLLAVILYLDQSSLKYSKNASTLSQLNLLFWVRLVASPELQITCTFNLYPTPR